MKYIRSNAENQQENLEERKNLESKQTINNK